MQRDKLLKFEELRAPGIRRVFEAVRMVNREMSDYDDDDALPTMPAGVLMKSRQDGGGRQWE